jgi:hypothetical protein
VKVFILLCDDIAGSGVQEKEGIVKALEEQKLRQSMVMFTLASILNELFFGQWRLAY